MPSFEVNYRAIPPDATILGRKAWTAYAQLALYLALAGGPIVLLAWMLNAAAGLLATTVFIAVIAYQALYIHSYRLYYDALGIWNYAGVLPWHRGSWGVKWRDLDEAVCHPSLLSWLLKSFTIRLTHRFTKANEIRLSHIWQGDDVIQEINVRHRQLIEQRRL